MYVYCGLLLSSVCAAAFCVYEVTVCSLCGWKLVRGVLVVFTWCVVCVWWCAVAFVKKMMMREY